MEITYTEPTNPMTERRKWHITCDEVELMEIVYAFGNLELERLPKVIRNIGIKALLMADAEDVPYLHENMKSEILKAAVAALKSVKADNSFPIVEESARMSLANNMITQEQCDAAIEKCRALHTIQPTEDTAME